jgi:peptide/nickel transport system substrate-binding protein
VVLHPRFQQRRRRLKKGEVDYIEQVPPDYINPLRADPNIKLVPSGSWQGWMVMNQLHPPFNNPKIRQAVLKAVNQDKFMAAMGYPKDLRVTNCATFFICGSPNETFAGAEPWRTPDVAKAKQLLAEAGYKGEKVVLLVPSDITYLNAEALMAAQTLQLDRHERRRADLRLGHDRRPPRQEGRARRRRLEHVRHRRRQLRRRFADHQRLPRRLLRHRRCPAGRATRSSTSCAPQWLKESNPAKRKDLLDKFHAQAYEALPYINAGQYSPAVAVRKEIKGAERLHNGLPLMWFLDK